MDKPNVSEATRLARLKYSLIEWLKDSLDSEQVPQEKHRLIESVKRMDSIPAEDCESIQEV